MTVSILSSSDEKEESASFLSILLLHLKKKVPSSCIFLAHQHSLKKKNAAVLRICIQKNQQSASFLLVYVKEYSLLQGDLEMKTEEFCRK